MATKKGTILENITIERLGFGGVGIGKLESGKVVLIKGGLPGSVVDCKVVKSKKDYLEAHIVTVQSVDKSLVDEQPRCPHYQSPYSDQSSLPEHKQGCGGCKRQGVSYTKQCTLKEKIVFDAFKIVGTDRFDFYPIMPSPLQYHYRNKIEFSFGKFLKRHPKDKELQENESQFAISEQRNLGFHKQGEFSKVVCIDQCYLVSNEMDKVYKRIKDDLMGSGLPVYDVKTHKGLLRHLVIREGVRTGQIMVNISLASKYFEENKNDHDTRRSLLDAWKDDKRLSKVISTLVFTHNNGLGDNVQGPDAQLETVRGLGYIFEGLQFEGVEMMRFQVSPFSFFQTNTYGAEILFDRAKKMVGSVQGNVIDLYCGSGSIGLSFLRQGVGKYVHGIDIVPSAIEDAQRNAQINGLESQATFHCGKAEKLLKEGVIDEQCFVGKDLIVIDPPRQGLHKDVVTFLGTLKKRHTDHRLLYISCNPVTMARDCKLLLEEGYKLHALQPVDMFPHTHHIETIGLLL